MAHVIYCDPEKDLEVRKLFRSLSPELKKGKITPKAFAKKVYPKFNSFLKHKQKNKLKALAKKEEKLQKSIKQLQYSKMWKKKVKCETPNSFMKRNEENIRNLRRKQEENAMMKLKIEEDTVSSCSFHPTIHKKSEAIGTRSVKDLYGWNKQREKKRLERLQKRNENEMSKCVGRFRSPQKRKYKNKSVHLSQR